MKYLGIFTVWVITLVAAGQYGIYETREVMEHEMKERLAEKCPVADPAPKAVSDGVVQAHLQACIYGLESCAEDLIEVAAYVDMCECDIEQASFR